MAEEIEFDSSTWTEVRVTTYFTLATSAIYLVVFEFSRRNPSVSTVFDRRRTSKPKQTPPPLMRSRIFEWLFLSTEPAYCEFADMEHQKAIILERKRQKDALAAMLDAAKDKNVKLSHALTSDDVVEEDVSLYILKRAL